MPRPAPSTRCSFRGCTRNQLRAGLCGRHLELAGAPLQTSSSPTGIADILTQLLNGQPIRKHQLEDVMLNAVEGLTGQRITIEELRRGVRDGDLEIDWQEVRHRVDGVKSRVSSSVASYKRRMTPEEEAARARARAEKQAREEAEKQQHASARVKAGEVSRARRILGYTAKEPIAHDQLKARFRQLARKWHPDVCKQDKHVAEARMREINWAMDILSQPG